MLQIAVWDFILFLLAFLRFTAALFFNPLLGRKNVPVGAKAGLAFLCALAAVGTLDPGTVRIESLPALAVAGAKELLIGFVSGFVIQLLLSTAVVAGELIDLQLGVGMAKIYDPQTNSSMPLSGTLLNLLLTLTFFLSNGHLTLIRVIALTFRALPPGTALLGDRFGQYLALLFGEVLVMAVKIALPVIAVELLAEVGMGALMRTAPQINVFSVSLQLRTVVGLLVLLLVTPALARMTDFISGYMFDRMEIAFRLMT